MKKLWEKVKWSAECIFVMFIVLPLMLIMLHFWKRDYEDYD